MFLQWELTLFQVALNSSNNLIVDGLRRPCAPQALAIKYIAKKTKGRQKVAYSKSSIS